MSKTYLEVGAGTTGNGRIFGYDPNGLDPGDELVLVDLQVKHGREVGLQDSAGYPSIIFPNQSSAESFIERHNCEDPYCKLCNIALIHAQNNSNYQDSCIENGIKLAHIFADGRSLCFNEDTFDEVLFRNVFSDPVLKPEDAINLMKEAARVSVGGVAVLVETYTPAIGVSKIKQAASAVGLTCEMYRSDNEGLLSFDLDHRIAFAALARFYSYDIEIPNAEVHFLRSK